MSFQFVHCSDVHLDRPFPVHAARLRTALEDFRRLAFTRLVDLCLNERVHALLVAGDLVDAEMMSLDTEAFLIGQLERLSMEGITVVIACGDRDHGGVEGRMADIRWPDGVHVISGADPREIEVQDASGQLVGKVIGVGHPLPRCASDLIEPLTAPKRGGVPTVSLAHVTVTGVEDAWRHDSYAPCTIDDLAARPFGYWALGHIHTRQEVCEQPPAHYPGSLVGSVHDEHGARGALLVSMAERGAPQVEFHSLAPLRFEKLVPTGLMDCHDIGEIITAVQMAFDILLTEPDVADDQEWMLRIELGGPCPMATNLRTDDALRDLAERLEGQFGVVDVEVLDTGMFIPHDLTEEHDQQHLLGMALAVMEEALEKDEMLDRIAGDVLCGAPSGDIEARRRYIREILGGLNGAAAEVLVRRQEPTG